MYLKNITNCVIFLSYISSTEFIFTSGVKWNLYDVIKSMYIKNGVDLCVKAKNLVSGKFISNVGVTNERYI